MVNCVLIGCVNVLIVVFKNTLLVHDALDLSKSSFKLWMIIHPEWPVIVHRKSYQQQIEKTSVFHHIIPKLYNTWIHSIDCFGRSCVKKSIISVLGFVLTCKIRSRIDIGLIFPIGSGFEFKFSSWIDPSPDIKMSVFSQGSSCLVNVGLSLSL